MATINDAYYAQLGKTLRDCAVDELSAIIGDHKTNMLAAKFDEPPEKVFAKNLSWLAQQIIMQPDGQRLKKSADITDTDLAKLEVLRAEYGFDYLKDLRINFTADWKGQQLDYSESFLIYMASKPGDFTGDQAAVIEKLVKGFEAEGRKWMIGIGYGMRPGRGNNHNDDKNLFHVLMEGELTPNKKKVAELVAPELAQKSYRVYAHTDSWVAGNGRQNSHDFEAYRNALHSAVASGRMENVEYALSKGAKQSTLYTGFGSTAFAEAVARARDPAYRAIALRLFDEALTQEDGVKILREASRWERDSLRPIEVLGRLGDVAFAVALAQKGGSDENPLPYIRQAVFNLDPKEGSYKAYQDIFGKAVTYLVESGALTEADIPEESLTDQRSLNFIFSLRAAAEAEKSRDPSFLAKTAVFTDGFDREVRKAKIATNNFKGVYAPSGVPSAASETPGAPATEEAVAVRKPLQFKKPGIS